MREQRKQMVGRVTSNKMEKSVVVEVERVSRHPMYGKVIGAIAGSWLTTKRTSAASATSCELSSSRPLSSRKRWVVEAILEHSATA